MQQEKRFLVYNTTDGVFAHPDAMTLDEAAHSRNGTPGRATI